jgi:anaerobic dimethyl sulfoxide reductase subunit C (anchor subunit)
MNVREWALPVYTILIQIATGILLMLWIFRSLNNSKLKRDEMDQMIDNPITIIFLTIVTAIIGAHFHLSRPYLSFLAVFNFKSSWLSREIVFTVIFFLAVGSLWILRRRESYHRILEIFLGWFAVVIGFVSIYCMARIYLLPTQITWNSPITITYYLVTTLLLGSMATTVLFVMDLKFAEVRELDIPKTRVAIIEKSLIWFAIIASIMAIMVFVLNFYQISYLQNAGETAKTSLDLLSGLYQPLLRLRLGLMPTGVGLLVISVILMIRKKKNVLDLVTVIYISCLLVMIAEILGRFIFYATHVRLGL